MTEIIKHPAKHITACAEETLEQYKQRLRETRIDITYKNGVPIDLRPDLVYSCWLFGLPQLAAPEEYAMLSEAILGTVAQLEKEGKLPKDFIQSAAAILDVTPPAIPERFLDEVEEGITLVPRLAGETYFDIISQYPPDTVEGEEIC